MTGADRKSSYMSDMRDMRDLVMLDELGAQLDPVPGHPPERLRHRVLNSFAPHPRKRKWHRLVPDRPALRTALAAAGLAAVVAVVHVLDVAGFSRAGQQAQTVQPRQTLRADQILLQAAAQASRLPALTATPSQFVYVKSVEVFPLMPIWQRTTYREAWLSADGTRTGQLIMSEGLSGGMDTSTLPLPGCSHGIMAPSAPGTDGLDGKPVRCTARPAYLGGLPVTVQGMLDYLRHLGPGGSQSESNSDAAMFTAAADLIREAYAPPQVLATLFKALATLKGFTVQYGLKDAAGQSGIALVGADGSSRGGLLFAPDTYAYLGEVSGPAGPNGTISPDSVNYLTTIVQVGIVDRVGQRP